MKTAIVPVEALKKIAQRDGMAVDHVGCHDCLASSREAKELLARPPVSEEVVERVANVEVQVDGKKTCPALLLAFGIHQSSDCTNVQAMEAAYEVIRAVIEELNNG